MPHITILGLGPGEWKHLTLEAVAALNSHAEVWLRTRHHPLVAELPAHLTVHSFDALYDEAEEFAALYQRIAAEVVRLGQRPDGVLYAVPGHPSVGETTVAHVRRIAQEAQLPVRIIEGLSFIEPSLTAVGADALDGLQIADATLIATRHYPPLDADRPVLVAQLYSRLVASDVKLTLMELYPADHPVTLLDAAGTGQAQVLTLPLYQLDQLSEFAYLSSLWVPSLAQPTALPHFQNIIAHLRAPEGCPWDREQDHHTLRDAVLEEAYEVADAIDREAPGDLCEELGDLLLLVTMHAQIAHEAGDFSMGDVIATVSEKLVRRHPHVFGTVGAADSEQVLQNWEAIKAEERAAKGVPDRPRDAFDEVAAALPALLRAQKITKRAQKQGWQPLDPVLAFAAWYQTPDETTLGNLLLALATQAGQHHLEAESALRGATTSLIDEMRAR